MQALMGLVSKKQHSSVPWQRSLSLQVELCPGCCSGALSSQPPVLLPLLCSVAAVSRAAGPAARGRCEPHTSVRCFVPLELFLWCC